MQGITGHELSSRKAEYLKYIHMQGDVVKTTEIAARFSVAPSTVTKALTEIAKAGYIEHRPYHGVRLTSAGTEYARFLLRRHRIVALVLSRHGYIKKAGQTLKLTREQAADRIEHFGLTTRTMTEEEAVQEASRCLNCGCGEGCQICKTICSVFAPYISAPDILTIDREECVACGMCALRCPIHNIDMISLGTTI